MFFLGMILFPKCTLCFGLRTIIEHGSKGCRIVPCPKCSQGK